MAIAVQTPRSPKRGARLAARVRRTAHMEPRLIAEGMMVSAAPMNTPLQTMAAANIGSAQASMRRTSAPKAMISSTGDMMAISSGANTHISTPMKVMTVMPRPTDM